MIINSDKIYDFPSVKIRSCSDFSLLQIEFSKIITPEVFIDILDFAYEVVISQKIKYIIIHYTKVNLSVNDNMIYFLYYYLPEMKKEGIKKIGIVIPSYEFGKLDIIMHVISSNGILCKQFLEKEEALNWVLQERFENQ